MSRTPRERLTDIANAVDRVRRAVQVLQQAEAEKAEDAAELAFDALLYRLVVIGEAVKVPDPGSGVRQLLDADGRAVSW